MVSFAIPPEERAARRVGRILGGKYTILRVLGVGGMATVYEAVHRNGRRVAVKILHEELNIHREVRARFVREGYAANAVAHPGAVHVFDDDVDAEGNAFLVMELLLGETLHDRFTRRGRRLPCREVLALAHQLLDVLAAAHGRGIIHRDIKPENLFLTSGGVLKVLDFGVARMLDDAGSAHVTGTGVRIGTPAFMAPEQALGRTTEIDARTDLWAVGATMFSLLAGRTVHKAQSAAELIVITATTPPGSLAEAAPELPSAVCAAVDRALQLPRQGRWEDARAMQRALEEAHKESFGEPLSPADVGPPPVPAAAPAPSQDERETLPAEGPCSAPLPPPPFSTKDETDVTSGPTWPSDRPPPLDLKPLDSSRGHTTVQLGPRPETGPQSRPGEDESPSPTIARPPAKQRASWALPAAMLAAAATLGALGSKLLSHPQEGSTPAATLSGAASSGPAPQCVKSADCKSDPPSICRKSDGACVALATSECKVLASPGDIENDATVWIGAMFPIGEDMEDSHASANGVELARRDFAQTTGGLPPARPGGPKRPIGVVLCDDIKAPERGAEHLVRDLHVPAILGFARSKEVMDLTTSLFLPNDVLALAANTSSALRDLPRSAAGPRLVWRTTTSTDMNVPVLAAVLSDVIEPEVRGSPGMLAPGEPVRVAFIRVANPTGQSYADGFLKKLRFNGKSVADNGANFLQIEAPDPMTDKAADDRPIVERVSAFRPHVIVPIGGTDEIEVALEKGWPAAARFRPRYLTASGSLSAGLLDLLRKQPEMRRRYHAVDAAGPADALARFVLRYNEIFSPHVTALTAVPAPYDSFYVFAYAAAALGDRPLTGSALASMIPRLLPGGERITVGQADIFRAFYALGAGKSIDLGGAQTTLDFDLDSGDATTDFALLCVAPASATEPPRQVDSGVYFRAASQKLEGQRHCP